MNLGFTFYPQDWWTSDKYFSLDAIERYLYLECIFKMYSNGGYLNPNKSLLETQLRTEIKPETWNKITQFFTMSDLGYSDISVLKRLKKSVSNRVNGQKGGRPKKTQKPNSETQNNPPYIKEDNINKKEEEELKENPPTSPHPVENNFIQPQTAMQYKPIDECRKEYDSRYLQQKQAIQMNHVLNDEQMKDLQDAFDSWVKTTTEGKIMHDYCTHFSNWVNKNPDKIKSAKKPQTVKVSSPTAPYDYSKYD
jgi:hypothetical protein